MILAEILLEKRSDWRPAGEGRQCWSMPLPETGWSIDLIAERVDSIADVLWEVSLRSVHEPIHDLHQWAKRIANRVSGLMEPLVVHEIDTTQAIALLRSQSPTTRSTGKLYYELRLEPMGAVLRRYQVSPETHKRTQIGFALTHETLAKLVDDLVRE